MENFIIFCTVINILCCVYFEFKLIRLYKILFDKELIYSDNKNDFWEKGDV